MVSRSLACLTVAVGIATACRSDRSATQTQAPATADSAPAAAAPTTVTFTATDYALAGPAQVPAGTTTLRLVNQGKELHHLVLLRLEQGKTFEDLQAALKNPGPPPAWVKTIGGPNAADPGSESNATAVLTAGQYAAICFIPSSDGVPHLAKGMVTKLEVTPASGPAAAEPEADVVMRLHDYNFELSKPLTPGTHVIRVENAGPQQHEVVLVKLAPGKSMKDIAAWEQGGMKGPPPAATLGGASPMDVGEHNTFSADLTPGDYLLLCFVPDAKDGKPHHAHGMALPVKVG